MKYILALDQGTTNSRAIIFNQAGSIVSKAQNKLAQIYPKPGEVEQDPEEIWHTQLKAAKEAVSKAHLSASDIVSIGISNQRETTILWDKHSGNALYNAIVWQCRRTTDICNNLRRDGWENTVKSKTGLVIDPYFSGTKIKWILDNVHNARAKTEKGEVMFGTVDTWLIWKLTGGKIHITDYTNASRTMLFNIMKQSWDEDLLDLLDIPEHILPEARPSSEIYGTTVPNIFGRAIPIAGDAGDQQAALFGQTCFSPGMIKNTYGTGSFMLMNTGEKRVNSKSGLLTTIAVGIDNTIEYALEGSVFISGAAIQWLKDNLELLDDLTTSEIYATRVDNSYGVYMVPAFSGLGAPYWDPKARGLIIGITRGTNKNHIIRATLEAIAYQVNDVLKCMEDDSELKVQEIRVDGGAAQNNFLMQFQSDILDIPLVRPLITETTALGAAYLAGLALDYWQNREEIKRNWQMESCFKPTMTNEEREKLISGWKRAVARSKDWAT
ncbi:MAG: glycerol kinase GlpK [Candidatus Bathyarchaeota archaeon]|nr:MAG: glycerol kinase GlpK [Candidatus Bathyarchaeota archaeon]